jgi:hypothetical protein
MGPNLLFLFSMLQWVVTYMWLLVDEFNSQYWWNYPISLRTFRSRYLFCTGSSSSTIFIFQLGWAPNPFVQHAPMGCNVHVTTRGWIQLSGRTIPLLWDIGAVIVCTGSSSSNYFGIFQLGWALTLLFLFSMLQWVVTYMCYCGWIQLSIELELSLLETLDRCVRTGSSSSNIFGIFQLGWALTCFSQHAQWVGVHSDYSWMKSTPRIGGTIPIYLRHWSRYYVQALVPAQLFLGIFQ